MKRLTLAQIRRRITLKPPADRTVPVPVPTNADIERILDTGDQISPDLLKEVSRLRAVGSEGGQQ